MMRPTQDSDPGLTALRGTLAARIPGSHLTLTTLPLVPEIKLYLLNGNYPRNGLPPDQANALMDNPPYWSFCWASGQVLARCILDQPARVRGKILVDFGAGSGVVGIAALLAGAERVIVCDQDPHALRACLINAQANGVWLQTCADLDELLSMQGKVADTITVADVFYDRDNLPLLETFQQRFQQVLVADSRLKGQPLPGMASIGRFHSHTVPDLDESGEFNRVTVYESGHF